MKNDLSEEKALLRLKGQALRLKLERQAMNTHKNLITPINQFKQVSHSLFTPLLLTLAKRKMFTKRHIAYLTLGLSSFFLLAKRNKN